VNILEEIESKLAALKAATSDKTVPLDIQREVRFAVVMYGGVSLAIYINGVAQELLSMVRATAPEATDEGSAALLDASEEKLPGAMGVYRKLGQYLAIRDRESRGKKLIGSKPTTDAIQTRLIVDVISGTSAGGINGVFLAKALARNQDMEGLKKLWLQEGDLGKLLNDPRSLRDLRSAGIKRQSPPQSLLNSRRMYRKLLEALAEMGKKGETEGASPLVSELDLFVTATDIEGIPLPISLADDVIYERRYKNVFHFRYAPDPRDPPLKEDFTRDDFRKGNDPFLAFAARCTSSFPFAFEAMRLADIEDILEQYDRYANDDPKEARDWDQFFKDYLRLGLYDIDKEARRTKADGLPKDAPTVDKARARLRKRFRTRAFGDGGYLDNKPFSHATSMLMRRHADSVVARKLVYVEPTPQHPEFAPQRRDPPDFAENISAAVLDLPRQETIREDLEHLEERNEMLERIGTFALHADADFALAKQVKPMTRAVFEQAGLEKMINHYGVSYGAYHRLNVEEITNLLATSIARALGHDPCSEAADAFRELTIAWRQKKYHELEKNGSPTENEFLIQFDVRYRLRRLTFLTRRVNQLARIPFDADSRRSLSAWLDHETAKLEQAPVSPARDSALLSIKQIENGNWLENESIGTPRAWLDPFQEELRQIKKTKLAPGIIAARFAEEQFARTESRAATALAQKIDELKLPWPELEPVLSENEPEKKDALERIFTPERKQAFQEVANIFRAEWSNQTFTSVQIKLGTDVDLNDPAVAARCCLQHYYDNFNLYDLITFPVQYGTGAGEANVVDVYRISPEDATLLMEERPDAESATKLAGRAVMSFGAFLDEPWRRNDMLWGRLDGAERLISILLAGDNEETREWLIREAHLDIINQEIEEGNADAVCRLLSHALTHTPPQEPCGQKLGKLVREVLTQNTSRLSTAQQTTLMTPQTLNRQLQPRRALEYISRSTNITGDMLSGLADKYQSNRGKTVAKWIAGVGSTLWNIIAVAVPQSLGNLFFRHLLGLFYFFAFLLIFVGIFLNNSVKSAGWQLLGILALIQLIVSVAGAFICAHRWFMKLAVGAIVSPLVALMILGLIHIAERWSDFEFNRRGELTLAVLVAMMVVLFFVIVPAIVRATTDSFRRMRD
jgi:patatin-related protein